MGWEDETNSIEEEQKETEILISLSNSLIVDKINILKNAKGLNNSTLAQLAGISNSTLTEILKGRTAKIPIQSLISIAKVLDCTVEYLYNDNISDRYYGEKHIIDQYEFNHIEKYRALDEYGKKAVDSILNLEYERATNKEEQSNKVKEFPKTEINDKEIVSTAQSAAFGDGTELITYTKEEDEELSKLHDRLDEIFKK